MIVAAAAAAAAATVALLGVAVLAAPGAVTGLSGTVPGAEEGAPRPAPATTAAPAKPDGAASAFCGSGDAGSTAYVREFAIPADCTGPLAIATGRDGGIWFAQTGTGGLARFDPATEGFTQYDNPLWTHAGEARSMMWGLDGSRDGHMWFTDEAFDSVWRFSVSDGRYERFDYPSDGRSLPQRLLVDDSQTVIINDLTGNKLTFLDPGRDPGGAGGMSYFSIPSPVDGSVTAAFAIDPSDGNRGDIWYTNWVHMQGGVLVKFDRAWYEESVAKSGARSLPLSDFVQIRPMPPELLTPNGIAVTGDGTVWLADTSSSSFFSFDPPTGQFVRYVTADPQPGTYGNQTGVVKSPISRPYWIDTDERGRIVLNAHAANNISVMDPVSQSIVEYHVPSRNPAWGDCGGAGAGAGAGAADPAGCGLAQVFDFAVRGHEIWFTEWVENKIGVVDTSVPPPVEVRVEPDSVTIAPGGSSRLDLVVAPVSQDGAAARGSPLVLSAPYEFLDVRAVSDGAPAAPGPGPGAAAAPRTVGIEISVLDGGGGGGSGGDNGGSGGGGGGAVPGTYKVLLGIQAPDIAVGKFVTVTIP